jgi:hypothetical protein
MLLPKLSRLPEVVVACGMNSAPSSKPSTFFSSWAKPRQDIHKINISTR